MFIENCKYVVLKKIYGEFIFPFDPSIKHSDFAKMMETAGCHKMTHQVVSAGFIDEFMNCYGSSESLRVSSRPEEDTRLLHKLFNISDKDIVVKNKEGYM